jgi:DNA polymerase IV
MKRSRGAPPTCFFAGPNPRWASRFSFSNRGVHLARGIDHSEVVPNRPKESISAENTFEHDALLAETESVIRRLAEKVWAASRKESRIGRTVTLKLKTSDFKILTRNHTPCSPPASCEELVAIAMLLRERANLARSNVFVSSALV